MDYEERLAAALQQSNRAKTSAFPLSLSTGVLACDEQMAHASVEDLLELADALMYKRKRTSRQRNEPVPSVPVFSACEI